MDFGIEEAPTAAAKISVFHFAFFCCLGASLGKGMSVGNDGGTDTYKIHGFLIMRA